jgi:hypothetical protein
MGFLKKITRQINIKNVSPVAKLVSVVQPTAQKVIETKDIGIKDVLAVSPMGISQTLTNTGTSNIVDVIVDKPIIPVAEVETISETKTTETTPAVVTPAVVTPVVKKKPNTLMYAGIGVGALVLGYFGYKMFKK